MSEEKLIRILKSLPLFAKNFLIIHDRLGLARKFEFNRAQIYIHERLEKQLEQTGKVRALILKGRQQGCCFSPKMRVITADYKWKLIKDIKIGDELIGCDEETYGTAKAGRKHSRKLRTTLVEHIEVLHKEIYEVILDNGARLEVTGEHRMLSKQRGGDYTLWREIKDFKVGDCMRVITRPPTYGEPTYEDGWFSGIIDGEGSARLTGAKRISVHQVEGKVLKRMRDYFDNIDMPYKEVVDKRTKCGQNNKLGDKYVFRLDIHRLCYLIELFARCRPTRFTNDKWYEGHELPGKAAIDGIKPWTKVLSIKKIGAGEVIDLQTSTKTFICEGLVSHNSTYVQGRFFHKIVTKRGKRAFILTHLSDATRAIFEMTKRYSENLDSVLFAQPDKKNDNTLMYNELASGYRVGTAGSAEIGRSMTNQYLHLSEYAFYKDAERISLGLLQTVAELEGTEIIKESTANGIDNDFYVNWQEAKNGKTRYQAIFVPWYWQEEYCIEDEHFIPTDEEREWLERFSSDGLTKGHLNWRRIKLEDFKGDYDQKCRKFRQEYPFTDDEAFLSSITDTFIAVEHVVRARKNRVDSDSPLIIGVDPARHGDDRTAIIRRKGRRAFGLETHYHIDTMELAGIIRRIIEKEHPRKICIDSIGIGAGVVDRLHEMGYSNIVEGINVARRATLPDKYRNLRAELWDNMRSWLIQEMPVELPDSDELQTDLTGLGYRYDSSDKLLIEGKDDARKRGLLSPDTSDALSLTFIDGNYENAGAYLANRMPESSFGMFT